MSTESRIAYHEDLRPMELRRVSRHVECTPGRECRDDFPIAAFMGTSDGLVFLRTFDVGTSCRSDRVLFGSKLNGVYAECNIRLHSLRSDGPLLVDLVHLYILRAI